MLRVVKKQFRKIIPKIQDITSLSLWKRLYKISQFKNHHYDHNHK